MNIADDLVNAFNEGYEKGKADAVPVVRCGECKYYGGMLPGSDKRMICYKFMLNFDNDFFCRDGERQDDGAKMNEGGEGDVRKNHKLP